MSSTPARCLLTAVAVSAPLVSCYLPSPPKSNYFVGTSLTRRRTGSRRTNENSASVDGGLSYSFRDVSIGSSSISSGAVSTGSGNTYSQEDDRTWGDLLAGGAFIPLGSPIDTTSNGSGNSDGRQIFNANVDQATTAGEEGMDSFSSSPMSSTSSPPLNVPPTERKAQYYIKKTGKKITELRRRTDEVLSGHSGLLSSERKRNRTYVWLLDSWCGFYSTEPDAPDRASRLLHHLEKEFPHLIDVRTYTKVITTYAKSYRPDAGHVAESILRGMTVPANSYTYNSAIHAWSNSGDASAATRAESLLQEMENLSAAGNVDVKPTSVSFNAVIDCLAKTYDGTGAERAEELLRHMEELYETGQNVDAKPNVRSFNSVINAWAKSGTEEAALKAEAILDLMERMGNNNDPDVRPDVVAFATVINAWARSQRFGKAERVLNIYRHMKELYQAGNESVRPNVVIYNSVMNACAFSLGDMAEQNRAVEIAHHMLKELECGDDGDADQITYGTFLKVCLNQMPDSDTRRKVVRLIFRNAQRDGQVGTMVLQTLRMLTGPEMYHELTGRYIEENIDVADLPREWTCNVVEGKWKRRRYLY